MQSTMLEHQEAEKYERFYYDGLDIQGERREGERTNQYIKSGGFEKAFRVGEIGITPDFRW